MGDEANLSALSIFLGWGSAFLVFRVWLPWLTGSESGFKSQRKQFSPVQDMEMKQLVPEGEQSSKQEKIKIVLFSQTCPLDKNKSKQQTFPKGQKNWIQNV